MRYRALYGLTLVLLVLISVAAFAQDTGYITGTITDKSGAALADADVTVSNSAQGITRATKSNSTGNFTVAGLPAGNYSVTVKAAGFKKFEANDVVLRATQKLRFNAQMEVGSASSEVTVQADATAVETQSSDLSASVTGKQISQLELNGRNFTQLVTLIPGVTNQTGQDDGAVGITGSVQYSMNGGRTEYNNWEIDGGDNMDNGSNASLNVYPSLDSIEEFRVLTSNYGAQYGRNGSGTVEVVTKSGTNKFHGTASYYGRNEFFNARNYFDDPTQHKPAYKKHDYGYTVGGPIFIPKTYNTNKDKTFFFWSEEWRKEKNVTTFSGLNVPSDAERNGDFSELCPGPDCPTIPGSGGTTFPGNIVPVDTANAAPLLATIPHANTVNAGFPAYQASVSTPTDWREELIKVDHNITPNVRATFRFIHDSWNTVEPSVLDWSTASSFPTMQTHFVGPAVSLVARLTATISPKLLNEFVFSYTTDHITLTNQGPWQRPASMTMTGLFANGFGGKIPGFEVVGGTPYGGGFTEDPSFIPWNNSNPTYTFRDNINKIWGKHNLQFGAYYVAAQKNEQNSPDIQGFLSFDNSSGVTTGNAFADLLVGNVAKFSQSNSQVKYYNRYKLFEPYIQDDWHATSRLTLNLGVRLSMFGTYRERYKQAYNFNPSAWTAANAPQLDIGGGVTGQDGAIIPASLGGTGSAFNGIEQCGAPGITAGCMKGHLWNFAPRIGFAFDPKGNGKLAIRAGYGIFYEHTNGNEANSESLEGTPPLVLTPAQFNIVGYNNIGGGGLLFPLAVTSIPSKAIWPYIQQWHLDIQKDLGFKTIATVSYVGSKGTHLTAQRNLNQLHSVPDAQNPYKSGEPIGPDDCTTMTTPSGVPITGQAATNLSIAACGASPDPLRPLLGFGDITRIENNASSTYNALQVSARRNAGPVILSLAYTYSHSIDDSSDRYDASFVDSYDLRRNRGSSNFDQRHAFNLSYIYDIPLFKSPGLTHTLLGGWQLSGITTVQTGTPLVNGDGVFNVLNSSNFADNAGVANGVGAGSLPDLVGNPNASPGQRNIPGILGPLLYNPAAFALPRGLTFGNTGRNIINLPRRTNFDIGLFKHFVIKENQAFEFRWETFNLFNHTQFDHVDTNATCFAGPNNSAGDPTCVASSTFLHPTSAHRARTMQFGLKFSF